MTGGAGYIGSHVVRELLNATIPVVVLDNLVTGVRSFVPDSVPFVEADLLDTEAVEETLREERITGVIHIAGFKFAGISVEKPVHTYEQNVTAMMSLLRAMESAGVKKIVFSSSSSVYGNAASGLVTEDHPFNPTSPYGESKVIGEWMLRNQGVAEDMVHTSLRYFNVVGSGSPDLPDVSPYNLFSMVFAALEEGRVPQIFGTDYDTPDGTCVRDYIHVADLAAAHVAAARRMDRGEKIEPAYNLGSGTGTSVAEIMTAIAAVTGQDFSPVAAPRRAGDPARVVASGELAARDIEWRMTHSLESMISTAWEARKKLPRT
ncbi:MAG: UDP-glucose 4-epimerase [Actinomycetota bacterium]